MRLRFTALAIVAALAWAAPARADFTIAAGVKWLPLNYTQPVSTTGSTAMGPTLEPLSGWNTTSINNYAGVFILDGKLGFTIGMDLGYSSRNINPGGTNPQTNLSFTQFGFTLGAKYYLIRPRAGRVTPYALFDFYKYFASVSTSDTVPKGTEGLVGGLVSPLGIDLAVGAEYWFTNNFGLGAEIFGLKYAYTEGDISTNPGGFGMSTTSSQTNHYVTFYTGVSLNFRWDFTGGMKQKTEVEDVQPDAGRPAHRNKALTPQPEEKPVEQPPPTEQPPKETESVD